MLNTSKIEKLRALKKITQDELSNRIGITRVGYQGILKRNDLKVSVLINIAKYFNVSLLYFFDSYDDDLYCKENLAEDPQIYYGVKEQNEMLKKLIKEKDKVIKLLENKLKD